MTRLLERKQSDRYIYITQSWKYKQNDTIIVKWMKEDDHG